MKTIRATSILTCVTLFAVGMSLRSSNVQGQTTKQPSSQASPSNAPVAPTPSGEAHARGDIAGDWQGTLQAGRSLRIILKIMKTDKGWGAKMYSIDKGAQPINVSSIVLMVRRLDIRSI